MLGDITSQGRNNSTPVSQWDQHLTVEDCSISKIGLEYSGAAAIFGGYIAHTTIQHNEIVNSSWSAIAIGWVTQPTQNQSIFDRNLVWTFKSKRRS